MLQVGVNLEGRIPAEVAESLAEMGHEVVRMDVRMLTLRTENLGGALTELLPIAARSGAAAQGCKRSSAVPSRLQQVGLEVEVEEVEVEVEGGCCLGGPIRGGTGM